MALFSDPADDAKTVVKEKASRADAMTYCIVCGPPIMIKFTQPVLTDLGWADEKVPIRYRQN